MKKMIGLIVMVLVMVWAIAGSAQTNLIVDRDKVVLGGDLKTDRWLNSNFNTLIGVGVAGAGHLTHGSGNEGLYNTALGHEALYSNVTGWGNTVTGWFALHSNTTGSCNTATGVDALENNTIGSNNTATGLRALLWNGGDNNTATGYDALNRNSSGFDNTATGYEALYLNNTGDNNTATGLDALYSNTTGYQNVATGSHALYSSTGSDNTATGSYALYSNNTGNYNTALGYYAGYNATTGDYNIFIGGSVSGTSSDDHVIRIGSEGTQTQTYIAGIYGASIGTSSAVYVKSNGQLGTDVSSRRFKEDIQDMGEASSRLMKLRPVTFHYKPQLDQEDQVMQYGLIAEEVAETYPELVQYGKDGEPLTVRYHELAPMLVNEVQKQQEQIKQLNQALNEKDARIQKLERLFEDLKQRIAVMESPAKTVASK